MVQENNHSTHLSWSHQFVVMCGAQQNVMLCFGKPACDILEKAYEFYNEY